MPSVFLLFRQVTPDCLRKNLKIDWKKLKLYCQQVTSIKEEMSSAGYKRDFRLFHEWQDKVNDSILPFIYPIAYHSAKEFSTTNPEVVIKIQVRFD